MGRLSAIVAVLTMFFAAAMVPSALAATVSPLALSFTTEEGTTSASKTVTITNDGPVLDLAASVTVTTGGTDGASFDVTDSCGLLLDAGASCTAKVTFSPPAPGTFVAQLNVMVGLDLYTVELDGTGTAAPPPPAPDAQVSPSSLAFSAQAGTTSSGKQVTLKNTGDAPLTISGVAIVGGDSARFERDNGCGGTLNAGASCTVTVSFKPVAEGPHAATLEFSDDAPSGTQRVTLNGTATAAPPPPAPGAQVSPGSLSFATQAGTTSGGRQVTLKNTGTATLNIASIALVGSDPSSFGLARNCGTSLAAGASCTVTVTFSPTQAGVYDAVLRFTDDAPSGTQDVDLNGSANAVPGADVSPDSLTFAAQVGASDGPFRVTLKNTGLAPLRIASIKLIGTGSPNFSLPGNTCPATLAPGATCTVEVAFTPLTAGGKQATLLFTDDAPGGTQRVTLEGTATVAPPRPKPEAEVSPGSLSFATEAGTVSRTRQVTLMNTGNAPLTIASIGLAGSNASSFGIAAKTCGASLAAGASCTVTVVFSPARAGDYTAVLRFTDDDASRTQDVDLNGSANAFPGADVSPGSLTFAAQVATSDGPLKVTLTNTGRAPLRIASIKLTGAGSANFSIPGNTCPVSPAATLAPGATCTVDVTFAPLTAGGKQATLLFTDDAPGGTQRVTLDGSATITPPPPAPAAQVSPSSLAFATPVGTTSSALPVTLTNIGDAPLRILSVELGGQDAADFAVAGSTCATTLAAGASCTVDVTFSPTTTNRSDARLRFTDNAPNPTTDVPLLGSPQAIAPSSGVASAVVTRPPEAGSKPAPFVSVADADRDGTPDSADACPTAPGDLTNGCQRALGADVRGVWRVNRLFTQLRNLTVRAPIGSRIDVRCSGARRVCPFKTRVIARTTRRITSLTNWFKRPRILPAGVKLTVRVTRVGRIGIYERLLTRRGRLLPKVTERCIDHQKRLIRCV